MPYDQKPSITSPSNPAIKAACRLHKKRERDSTGLTIVEGIQEIWRALEAGVIFRDLYYCPYLTGTPGENELLVYLENRLELTPVSKRAFSKMAYRKSSGGIIAIVEKPSSALNDIPLPPDPLYFITDSIEKPGNIGAILRSADGAGVSAVLASNERTDLFNPNVIRSSMGTVFSVPCAAASPSDTMSWLRKSGAGIIITAPEGDMIYTEADLTGPSAVVIGNESRGASSFWTDRSDVMIRIPMMGKADSLNASVSASLIAYEALRQRNNR